MTGQAAGNSPRFVRLTAFERMYLRDETTAWPCHFGGLAVVEGEALLDASGHVRLAEIRERLGRRLARVPDLRQRLFFPGPLRGGPLWVGDDRFAIEWHIREAHVPSPGGEAELLETAAQLYQSLLDRERPLWELWLLTGLSDGRIGVLLKLHHAVADGNAAVAVMGSLFDVEPDAADPVAASWRPTPIPGGWSLLVDNLCAKARSMARLANLLIHPMRIVRTVQLIGMVMRRMLGAEMAPSTSLNQVVQTGRRIAYLRLDLAEMKAAARAHESTVNDVVLDLFAGGLGALLRSRGELAPDLELAAAQAVSTRSTTDGSIDNQTGTFVIRLPAAEADVERRLELIIPRTQRAKAGRRAGAIAGVIAALSATPVARYFNLHQRAVNVIVTNVIGPQVPMYALGARILAVLPIIQLVGNIGLTLCAFSYSGQMFLVVTADVTAFADLDVLMAGMERDWHALIGSAAAELIPAIAEERIEPEAAAAYLSGDPVGAAR